jgi:lysine/ornithine N-monooxygenase
MKVQKKKTFDVCIIGAGPASLAVLSAIQEPYSMDSINDSLMNKANQFININKHNGKVGPVSKEICVIDPHPCWMDGWKNNFDKLGIEFLRSPTIAHPDHFDTNALLAYAITKNREDELIESGCYDNKYLLPLGQTQIGLWKLPSTKLFQDFCLDMSSKLQHDYIQSTVHDISTDEEKRFVVKMENGDEIIAGAVVLALGSIGKPIIPPLIQDISRDKMFSWNTMKYNLKASHNNVLVVGGGLTAVQTAQYALRQGKNVCLCSRRNLVNRHFDIDIKWFDRRHANKLMSDFYHQDDDNRLSILRDARGGGSIPPIYLKDLKKWVTRGKLTMITGEVKYLEMIKEQICISFHDTNTEKEKFKTVFDCVILATGIKPDCTANSLVDKIQTRWPIRITGGFPCVSEDLEWSKKNLYVVGGLASMNTGPDSANLNGIRRAASIIANALECRCWLRNEETKVLSNTYSIFWDSSDDESDSDEDSVSSASVYESIDNEKSNLSGDTNSLVFSH